MVPMHAATSSCLLLLLMLFDVATAFTLLTPALCLQRSAACHAANLPLRGISSTLQRIQMVTPEEERQQRINDLRSQKVDVTRQAQEAGQRAYRARAAAEAKRKERAAKRRRASGTPADAERALLESMFSLSSEKAALEQSVDAAEEMELLAQAEAEEARYRKLLANLDLQIAALSRQTDSAASAVRTAEAAAAASESAGAAQLSAKRERSATLAKVADLAVEEAADARRRSASLRATSDRAAEMALAAVRACGGDERGGSIWELSVAESAAMAEAREEDKRVDLAKLSSSLEDASSSLEQLFRAGLDQIRDEEEAARRDLGQRWAAKAKEVLRGSNNGGAKQDDDAPLLGSKRQTALVEAARLLGLPDPFRASEEDVEEARRARAERAKQERAMVDEASARLGKSAPRMREAFRKMMQTAADRGAVEGATESAGGGDGGAAGEMAAVQGDTLAGWETTLALKSKAKARAAEEAAAELEAAVEAMANAAAAGGAEDALLRLELEVRTRKERADSLASDAAAARAATLRAAQETQAGLLQAASLAIIAAQRAQRDAYEAQEEAVAKVRTAAEALEEAVAAADAADDAESSARMREALKAEAAGARLQRLMSIDREAE
jgi:hypothetical protein